MKRAFFVHRWSGSMDEPMMSYLATELSKRGFEVHALEMPHPDEPSVEEWVAALSSEVSVPDNETFFVAQSIGAQTVMRYLETIETVVGGALFVAGWFNLAGLNKEGEDVAVIARPWIETPVDFEKVKKNCPNITVFLSENDPYGFVEENKKTFEEKLGAEVTVFEGRGHFTEDDSVIDLPEATVVFDSWK